MKNRFNYRHTKLLCYSGYVVQAIVNNFVPLLFVFFHERYNIPLMQITFIASYNFALQLCIDITSVLFVDRIGYRKAVILSNFLSASGMLLLAILPERFSDPFIGILIAVSVYAIGGGLLEVIINPIIESCPSDNREAAMSILHSFYSWGCVAVILVSTVFFRLAGISNWKIIAVLWTVIPIINMVLFSFVPIAPLISETEKRMDFGKLARQGMFWLILLMMLAAGAAEMTISQWVSAFAEDALQVSKTVGDIAGAMFFAVLFGLSRVICGSLGDRLDLIRFMRVSAAVCTASFMLIVLAPVPLLSLIGCGIAGFSVGIFWPGTVSIAAGRFKAGGTLMFSLLAFAGDIGCTAGPGLVGTTAAACGDSLKTGIAAAIIFPLLMMICVIIISKKRKGL